MTAFFTALGIFLIALLQAIPVFKKWFPAETEAEKTASDVQNVADEEKKEQETGRPQWD